MKTLSKRLAQGTIAVAFAIGFGAMNTADAKSLKLGLTNHPGDPAFEGSVRLAERVKKDTGGRVEIKVFGRGDLGNNRKLFAQVRSGAIEMAIVPFGVLSDVVPEVTATLGGFFYDDWKELKSVLDAPQFGLAWNKKMVEAAGIRILGTWFQGARQVTMTKKAPRSPAEFSGVKLRAVPNPISLATVRGIGANPTPVPFPEVFGALRQGIVDGQENPVGTINSAKLYEVQKYLILTGHQRQALPWLINERAWKKLDAKDQAAITTAAKDVSAWASDYALGLEKNLVGELEKKGMTIVRLSDSEAAAFRKSVRAETRTTFDGKIWPKGLMDEILKFVE